MTKKGRKALDVRRMAAGLAAPGIDPRTWVSYGTVCTVGDDGEPDFSDENAVFIDGAGVEVDVRLEPLNTVVTCVYAGVQGGARVSIFSPIKAGDRVLVTLPDGDGLGPPVIKAILHSAASQLPMESGLPIFQNDRLLIYSEGQDVDVRAIGANATVTADNVQLGSRSADEPHVLGNRWLQMMTQVLTDLLAHKHATAVGPTSILLPPEAGTLLQELNALSQILSQRVFSEE